MKSEASERDATKPMVMAKAAKRWNHARHACFKP
jgi:hypothetical protein